MYDLLKGGDFVILYNDETTFKHESEEKYVECIDYLYEKWKANKENVLSLLDSRLVLGMY